MLIREALLLGQTRRYVNFLRMTGKKWEEVKVRMNFSHNNANVIINTRIPQSYTKDEIVWNHSSNGQYTVKTGYQQWHKNHISDVGLQQSKG